MLDFITGDENIILNDKNNAPITTSFIIVESVKGFMLLFNKYRELWELPGGMIERNESPGECVIRECKEESGQILSNITFFGLAKYLMKKNKFRESDNIEYSVIYYSFLDNELPFYENDEIMELKWWDCKQEIEDICPESRDLIKKYIHSSYPQSSA